MRVDCAEWSVASPSPLYILYRVRFLKEKEKKYSKLIVSIHLKLFQIAFCFWKNFLFDFESCMCSKEGGFVISIYFIYFEAIPARGNALMSALFPILEKLLICTFWYGLELFFIWMIVAKLRSFMGLFSFGGRKSLQGAKFGEYSGRAMGEQRMTCELAHSPPNMPCPKYPKKMHGMSQPLCRHSQQLL